MAHVFVTDFKQKRIVRQYDTQVEYEKYMNEKTCSICQETHDKRTTTLLEAQIAMSYSKATLTICEHCIREMYRTVEERENEL